MFRVPVRHKMAVKQTVIVHAEGDVVVTLAGLAVKIPAVSVVTGIQEGKILLNHGQIRIPAHGDKSGVHQHPEEIPVVSGNLLAVHPGQPGVKILRFLVGKAELLSAEHQRQGDGSHLHNPLVVVTDLAPVGRMLRIGAIDQSFPEQGQVFLPFSLGP